MSDIIRQAAALLAEYMSRHEEMRWAMGDVLYQASLHPQGLENILRELQEQHGLTLPQDKRSRKLKKTMGLGTAQNYARVAGAFSEEHRHYQYKWSNYLEWSKWENPVEAMEMALDNCYPPSQMRNLRLHGDTEYKKDKVCEGCGKSTEKGIVVCRKCQVNARRVAGGVNPLKYAWGDSG